MANLGTTFDASAVEPMQGIQLLPAGKYVVQIVASEMRVTKDGQGQFLWLELDVLEGPYAGRKLFDRLNLVNANPATVEIAKRTLSAICHAIGRMRVQDSDELHLAPMAVDVRVLPPKNGYGESNGIRYLPAKEAAQPARTAPVQSRPAPAASAPGVSPPGPAAAGPRPTAPWKRTF